MTPSQTLKIAGNTKMTSVIEISAPRPIKTPSWLRTALVDILPSRHPAMVIMEAEVIMDTVVLWMVKRSASFLGSRQRFSRNRSVKRMP